MCKVRMYRLDTCREDDGKIDPTLCRYGTLSSQDIPNIVIGCGKPWTRGDGDTIKEPT